MLGPKKPSGSLGQRSVVLHVRGFGLCPAPLPSGSSLFLRAGFISACLTSASGGRARVRENGGRELGEKNNKIKGPQQQRGGQEKYLIQTMNIVVSSHSLHSQSASMGRQEEPRNAGLIALPVQMCVFVRVGHARPGDAVV